MRDTEPPDSYLLFPVDIEYEIADNFPWLLSAFDGCPSDYETDEEAASTVVSLDGAEPQQLWSSLEFELQTLLETARTLEWRAQYVIDLLEGDLAYDCATHHCSRSEPVISFY
jgi:hypothetical protein